MNISIRYYTKGGNTEKLAKAVEEALDIEAKSVSENLTDKADILFLGSSYYAFDMDVEVKDFISANKDKIGKIVLFGTSAMMKSMKKPMKKLLKKIDADINLAEEEFHCRGSFGMANKGRPNDDDLAAIKVFAKKVIE